MWSRDRRRVWESRQAAGFHALAAHQPARRRARSDRRSAATRDVTRGPVVTPLSREGRAWFPDFRTPPPDRQAGTRIGGHSRPGLVFTRMAVVCAGPVTLGELAGQTGAGSR